MKKGNKVFLKKICGVILFAILLAIVVKVKLVNIESIMETEDFKANTTTLSQEEQELVNTSIQSATTIDVTGIVENGTAQHNCNNYLATAYNSTYHFKYCTVCGKDANGNYITVKDVQTHSFTDHWYYGYASCYYMNYNTRTCNCGYSEKTTQPHQRISGWNATSPGRNIHFKYCLDCGTWTISESCKDSSGRILSCVNPGTCATCGLYISSNSHYIYANGICRDCGKRFFTSTIPVVTYNSDRSIAYASFRLTPCNGAYLTGYMGGYTGTCNFSDQKWSSTRNSDGSVDYVAAFTFDKTKQQKCLIYIGANNSEYIKVNGEKSYIEPYNGYSWTIWQDTTAPTISSITERNISTVGSWATLKELTISGTENLSDIVTVKLIVDNQEIYSGSANVTNQRYSIAITPEMEATEDGKTITIQVSDRIGNTINSYYTVRKVDNKAPSVIVCSTSEEWSRSKNLSIVATDNGIGAVQVAFNNMSNYETTVQNGNKYAKTYELVGDVYENMYASASIYIKDSLGNVKTEKIKVTKIDNTAPTISSATVSSDKTTTTIVANDYNSKLNAEGSGVTGYYYVFDNKRENDFDINSASYTTSNNISNERDINRYSYIHIKAVDKVGNVSSSYTVLIEFALNTTVNLDAANGKGGVELEWGELGDGILYKAYQQKEGYSEWNTISTVDFYKTMEPIKVLNVYPHLGSNINTVTFTYSDGTTVNLPKSAALKVWMEGGTMNENGTVTSFEAYGKNPYTGQQLLYITPVSSTDFNNNPDMIWNYDVVMFGTWDTNGVYEDQPDDNALGVIEKFIQSGKGILCGHDTIGYLWNDRGLSKLRKYFNIETGKWRNFENAEGIDYKDSWGYLSTNVTVKKQGLLTNFPWELPLGATLTVPATHTCANAAKSDVWMDFINGGYWNGANTDESTNYYSYGTGDAYYYLTTYNNTAMIQTGHSNCNSTADERKVLANTLFYLKQLTSANSITDNSAQDMVAPESPKLKIISSQNNYASLYSNDRGSKYSFYVEAYDKSNTTKVISRTNTRTEIVTTGTVGYYYIIDNNETNDFEISNSSYTTDDRVYLSNQDSGKYLHVKAVDKAGNVSDVSDIYISFDEAGSLNKTATWIDADNAIAEITMTANFADNVSSVTSNKPVDMIIVQDTSNAMNSDNKLNISKDMIKNLANKTFDTVPDTRIALVQFGSSAEVKCGYVDTNSRQNLINAIDNLNCSGYSAEGLGLQKAIELINSYTNVNEREVRIVFVTDGKVNQNSKGLEEAKTLKENYNAKIYGIGVNVTETKDTFNIKNICDSANYINIQNSDYDTVYNKIFRNVVSYYNTSIVIQDTISNYFNIVAVQNGANINDKTVSWNIDTIKIGQATVKIRAQLKDEYRYFDKDLITKYITNDQVILNYTESEVVWGSNKNHSKTASSPELNYVYVAEKITVKVSGNKAYHGTEYFGLFTDETSTKAIKYQSITYGSEDSTTFSVMPGVYYLYMVDSNGNKLSDSNIWYYEVESTEGYIEEVTDGFKISNSKKSTISQTQTNKPDNVYNDILTVENTQNKLNLKRIWLNIAGNVNLDSNKDGNVKNEIGMENITVILHTIKSQGNEETLEQKTDENGAYSFKEQDIAYKHYVEFKYNGQYYEPTIYKANGVAWEDQSKAVDSVTKRKEFNKKFEVISSKSGTYTRSKLKADNIIDQYGNLISSNSGAEENFVKNSMISAYTGYNKNNELYADVYVYKTMRAELGYSNYDFTQFINLGLVERKETDIAITEDIFNVTTTINNKNQVYEYNNKAAYKTANIYEVDERVARGYYNHNYTREIYKSDYDYEGENGLEMYVKYQIAIKNKSDEIAIVANELVNYYDEDFTFQEIYLGDNEGKRIETTTNLFETDNSSKYGNTANIDGYKTLYIRTDKNKIKITAGGECYIYVTFKVNKNEKLAIEQAKANIVELNAYSTYYYIDNAMNKDNPKTQKEYEIGDIAGIVEKDSTPGNIKINEFANLDKSTMLSGKNATDLKNLYNVEDDFDCAPSLKITYEFQGEILNRSIQGVVWKENRDVTVYSAQIGDGIFEEEEEKIEGVTVELVNKNNNEVVLKTVSGANGTYTIEGFIPGEYYVRFVYGNNGGDINGQDYKSTVYKAEGFNSQEPDNDLIYDLKKANDTTIRESDARDLNGNTETKGTRKYVDNYCSNGDEGVTNSLATILNDKNSDEFKSNVYMNAKSALINIEIEYDRTSSKTSAMGVDNKGSNNYDLAGFYKLENLDFGLVERPKSQLQLDLKLSNVQVILSNGQTLFDAVGRATNAMWIAKEIDTDYYNGNFMKVPASRISENGKVLLTMDKELMHGATIKLTYKTTVTNRSEVDYSDLKFYYTGIEDKPYIEGSTNIANTNIVTSSADTIISYVGTKITDDGGKTRNNLQFFKSYNEDWEKITTDEIQRQGLIDTKILSEAKKYTTIIQTKALKDQRLVPSLVSESDNSTSTDVTLVETITSETSEDDRTYNCLMELVKVKNDVGRRMEYSVVGNQNPIKSLTEIDADVAESVVIVSPFGQSKIYYVLATIIGIILVVGIIGTIKIIKHK